jgi:hypothetical protein
MKKLFNIEVWKDFFDEEWRIKVMFWKWEVARFKITQEHFESEHRIEIKRTKY